MGVEGLTIKVGVDLTAIEAAEARVRALKAEANGLGRGTAGVPQNATSAAQTALNKAANIPGIANAGAGAAEKEAAIKRTDVAQRLADSKSELASAKAPTPKNYPVGYNFANDALITRNPAGDIVRYEKGFNFAEEIAGIPASQRLSGKSLFARAEEQVNRFLPFEGLSAGATLRMMPGANKFSKFTKIATGAGIVLAAAKIGHVYEQNMAMESSTSVRDVAMNSAVEGGRSVIAGVGEGVTGFLFDLSSFGSMVRNVVSGDTTQARQEARMTDFARIGLHKMFMSREDKIKERDKVQANMASIRGGTSRMYDAIDAINADFDMLAQSAVWGNLARAQGTGLNFSETELSRAYADIVRKTLEERNRRDIARLTPKIAESGNVRSGTWN